MLQIGIEETIVSLLPLVAAAKATFEEKNLHEMLFLGGFSMLAFVMDHHTVIHVDSYTVIRVYENAGSNEPADDARKKRSVCP